MILILKKFNFKKIEKGLKIKEYANKLENEEVRKQKIKGLSIIRE